MPPPRSSTTVAPVSHRRTLSSTLIDESVAAAAEVVQKYNVVSTTTSSGSLFLRSGSGCGDHNFFLCATADLHRAMLFFASHEDATTTNNNGGLVKAQELLQTAMNRLALELRLLLGHVDDDNNDDDHVRVMISSIIRTMMAAGYGKECLSTFKSTRRSALAAKLSIHSSDYLKNMNKLAWDQVDATIIQPWLCVASTAFTSLFPTEKELCDSVFADPGVGEAVFAAIVNDHATGLLAIAEAAVARARRAPERLFRVLDIHDALAAVEGEIISLFNNTTSTTKGLPPADDEVTMVATRAGLIIGKAAEAAGATLAGLETAILHKEASSKGSATPGGGVHPLTRYVMNYLVFLADYQQQQQLVEGIRAWIWRLVSSLLSKLESKAGSYKEAALSYLFLANNTHYVAKKVRGSSKIHVILGEDWAEAQSVKARGHVQVYTRAVWGKVISSTMMTVESKAGGAGVVQTGGLVMEAVQVQDQWMAADEEMGKALRAAATAAVIPKYRMFYRRHGAALSLTPGDINAMIAALFTNVLVPVSQEPNAVPQ
ncbi:hypothetical protein QOZ80_9AG0671730 [Eleusine coracana subsp. coracana]|nr:hypothetical protein QOZ80_9AG0671730 [Eleusine coracana subsp. coracana]